MLIFKLGKKNQHCLEYMFTCMYIQVTKKCIHILLLKFSPQFLWQKFALYKYMYQHFITIIAQHTGFCVKCQVFVKQSRLPRQNALILNYTGIKMRRGKKQEDSQSLCDGPLSLHFIRILCNQQKIRICLFNSVLIFGYVFLCSRFQGREDFTNQINLGGV